MHTEITMPYAVELLFGIKVSKESPFLKDKVNSFVRNGLIKTRKEGFKEEGDGRRQKVYLASPEQLHVVYNALILNAFYHDTNQVKNIFNDANARKIAASEIESAMGLVSNVAIKLSQSARLTELVNVLKTDIDLYSIRLPNPFKQLPQLSLGKNTGLLQALLVQASTLSTLDSAIGALMRKDWLAAKQLTESLSNDVPGILEMKELIEKEIKSAQDFDDTLDIMRNF
ncbi:hypothetical protein J3L11_01140 [Shewanella sp. 4t3-1-2LB]|jgi:hypothetical protein|uniref:hypothetical protein n=1 Tax=Shewanella sp. 4t3-1-2LB TaxID=2817682 RepID=UPI001A9902B6|nr:hypothetical protein [Shewanella sp. 4t3-1-2LB]MBO1270262.1 hypothetical protein [Shewanella sp. 4t3-1-2LB]